MAEYARILMRKELMYELDKRLAKNRITGKGSSSRADWVREKVMSDLDREDANRVLEQMKDKRKAKRRMEAAKK